MALRSLLIFFIYRLSVASAAFSQLGNGAAAADLRVQSAGQVATTVHSSIGKWLTHTSCIPDLHGGRLIAGVSMAGCIALTAGVTVALICYLSGKRPDSSALPGPAGPGADSGQAGYGATTAKAAPAKKKKVYMYTLDGMRTLLVTAVILAHYPVGLPSICTQFLGWPMQFFFVLSGFCAQCQEVNNEEFSWTTGLTYVTRRLVRILPMYQLALVLEFGLAAYSNNGIQPVLAWPINGLLAQVFLPVKVCGDADYAWTLGYTHFNGNGPAWFAACIVWFSCLFPLLYNARPRSGGLWTFGLLVATLGCRAIPDLVNHTEINHKYGMYGHGPHLYAMSPIRLLEYTAGMWAAQMAIEVAHRWEPWNGWCWIFDGALLVLVAMIYVSLNFLGGTWMCSGDYHLTAICCFVCATAYMAAALPEDKKQGFSGAILHRIIGSTPLTYLARFSFAAYIFQTSFMRFIDGDNTFHLHRFCILWLFSIFACMYFEEPIIKAVQSRLK
jgi:peptidoglycan/LPS O-acetylase OafA/YrhL